MAERQFSMFLCSGRIHWWQNPTDAQKCCGGWTRVFTPILYGSPHVDRRDWYIVGVPAMFVIRLLPTYRQVEIDRLNGIVPVAIRAKLELVQSQIH